MKKQVCDGCGNCKEEVHLTCIEVGGKKQLMKLCENCYVVFSTENDSELKYVEKKTNLRCVNCKKKLKKRIYSNGNVSYVCGNCRW